LRLSRLAKLALAYENRNSRAGAIALRGVEFSAWLTAVSKN